MSQQGKDLVLSVFIGTLLAGSVIFVLHHTKEEPAKIIDDITVCPKYGQEVRIKQLNKNGYVVFSFLNSQCEFIVTYEEDGKLIERKLIRNQVEIVK